METNNQTMQITADTLPSNIVLYGKPDVGKECGKNGEPLEGFSFTKPFLKSDYDLAVKMVKYIDQIIYGDTI